MAFGPEHVVVVSLLLTTTRARVRLLNRLFSANGGDHPSPGYFAGLLRGPNEIMDVEELWEKSKVL